MKSLIVAADWCSVHPTFWRPHDNDLRKGAVPEFRQGADRLLGVASSYYPTIPGQQCYFINPYKLTLKCRGVRPHDWHPKKDMAFI